MDKDAKERKLTCKEELLRVADPKNSSLQGLGDLSLPTTYISLPCLVRPPEIPVIREV